MRRVYLVALLWASVGIALAQVPTLADVSPKSGTQDTILPVTLTGTGFVSGSTVAIEGTGVTISNPVIVSSTQITLTVTIASSATTGTHALTVTAGGQKSNGRDFTVNATPPTLTDVTPNSGTQGLAVNVTLTGMHFTSDSKIMPDKPGVTVSNSAFINETQMTATLTIADSAVTGTYQLTVATGSQAAAGRPFTVNPAPPTLTDVSPANGVQNAQVNVTLNGTHFTADSTIAVDGTGVTVGNKVITDDRHITATLSIASSATLGLHGVTVTASGQKSGSKDFAVNPPPPTLSDVTPNSGSPGANVNVTLTGTNFGPGPTVTVDGAGVSVTAITLVSSSQITATFNITASATPGAHKVTVAIGSQLSSSQAFTIPTVTVSPPSAKQGQTLSSISISGQASHFKADTTKIDFGKDIIVNSVAVKSDTLIEASVSMAASAQTGSRTITVTTASEVISTSGAFAVQPSTAPSIKVAPLSGRAGDTVTVIVSADNCPADTSTQNWFNKDSLTVAGSDITRTYVQNDNCSATYSLVVAARPIVHDVTINITGANPQTTPPAPTNLGSFTFHIADSIPPGPIPPGLNPQVDVSWSLMSEAACSDQFGSRLARYYFCINVVLGNNTGYPLIIAAVGFMRHVDDTVFRDAAASYLSTRSMVQNGQILSARAYTIDTRQAAGAIIAGPANFSGNAGRKGRIAIWSTLVGTAAGLIGTFPDHTTKEGANLDDASLRDGRLISNNSPARFSVFVDRSAVEPLLRRGTSELLNDAQKAAMMSDKLNKLAANEQDPATATQFKDDAIQWDKWSREMISEAHRLNAEQIDPQKFRGHKKIWNPNGRKQVKLANDLLSVRRALGNLIIVGDQVEFRQRIQIDVSAQVPTVSATMAVTSSSGTVLQGKDAQGNDRTVDVVLAGRGLATVNGIAAQKCSPSFTVQTDPTGNLVTLKGFKVSGCTETAIPLQISNGSSVTTFNLPITPAPLLDTPAKTLVAFDTTANNKVTFTLTGKSLTSAQAEVTLTNGSNSAVYKSTDANPIVTVANSTDARLDVTIVLPAAYAAKGTTAKIVVSTPSGGQSPSMTFSLVPAPTLTKPATATITAGASASLPIMGTGLTGAKANIALKAQDGTQTTMTTGVTVTPNATTPDTALTIALTGIPAKYAASGTTISVTVTTDGGTSNSVDFTFQ
jgi:hypothetical protein